MAGGIRRCDYRHASCLGLGFLTWLHRADGAVLIRQKEQHRLGEPDAVGFANANCFGFYWSAKLARRIVAAMTRVMLVYVLLVLLGKFRELLAMVALRAGGKTIYERSEFR